MTRSIRRTSACAASAAVLALARKSYAAIAGLEGILMYEHEDLIWLAGLLEGEGCFHQGNPRCNTVQISISLSMTDEDVVLHAAKIMGAPSVKKQIRKRLGREHYKDDFRCCVTNDRAYVMMNELLPYMGLRRSEKIRELLHAYSTRTTRAEANRRQASRRKKCPQTASLF